jgi:hypothetical protein
MPRGERYEPTDTTRAVVRALAAYGVPHVEIAGRLGVNVKTLDRHYRRELDLGRIEANARVAERLFQVATRETADEASLAAMIFWLKCRAGWREARRHEVGLRTDVAVVLEARCLRADGEP